MRVLFFMSHPGFTRNYESTLRELASRGHQVEVVFDRGKDTLAGLYGPIERLSAEFPQITHSPAPAQRRNDAYDAASGLLRTSVDYSRYLEPGFASATKLRDRVGSQTPRSVRSLLALPPLDNARVRSAFRRALIAADRSAPLDPAVLALLEDRAPDLVLITPLLEMGSPQLDYLRAASSLGLPTVLCVASWDNLTSKGLIQELPDLVTVWNDAQRQEAFELHSVPVDRVAVTGAVAYDHWFGWRASTTWAEFSAKVGLRPDRPMILYVGSSGFIAPDESPHIRRVIEALRTSGRAGLVDVGVLVRPHPTNPLSEAETLNEMEQVRVWPPTGENPTDVDSRNVYFDSMHHARAVVGVNTSALIESAIVGRPVLSVLAEENRDTQEGTPHFQHLLRENGGPLVVARDLQGHVEDIAEAVSRAGTDGFDQFLHGFVRPAGLETAAAVHMVEALESCAGSFQPALPAAPASPALRALVRLVGLLTLLRGGKRRSRSRKKSLVALLLRSERSRALAYTRVRPLLLASARAIARAADGAERESRSEADTGDGGTAKTRTRLARRSAAALPPTSASGPVVAGPWTGSVASELLEWVQYLRARCQDDVGLAQRLLVVTCGTPADWYDLPGVQVLDVATLVAVPEEILRSRMTAGSLSTHEVWETAASAGPSLRALACRAVGIEPESVLDEQVLEDLPRSDPQPVSPAVLVPAGPSVCVRLAVNDVLPASLESRDLVVQVLHRLALESHVIVLADAFGAVDHVLRADPSVAERIETRGGLNESEQLAVVAESGRLVGTFDGVCVAAARMGTGTVGLVESLHRLGPRALAAISRNPDLRIGIVDQAAVRILSPTDGMLHPAS